MEINCQSKKNNMVQYIFINPKPLISYILFSYIQNDIDYVSEAALTMDEFFT